MSVIFTVAFCVSSAIFEISEATTAKPLPASPARAASILALSARRLVCDVISVIISTIEFIFAISSLRSESCLVTALPDSTDSLTLLTSIATFLLPASTAFLVSFMLFVISCEPFFTSSTLFWIFSVISSCFCTASAVSVEPVFTSAIASLVALIASPSDKILLFTFSISAAILPETSIVLLSILSVSRLCFSICFNFTKLLISSVFDVYIQ